MQCVCVFMNGSADVRLTVAPSLVGTASSGKVHPIAGARIVVLRSAGVVQHGRWRTLAVAFVLIPMPGDAQRD